MTRLDLAWDIINWLSLPVLAVVVGILVWRKLHREFPFFFSYLVVTELATIVRLAAQFQTPRVYFYTYWISDLIIAVFNFLAIYELFLKRLFPGFYRVRVYRYLFPSIAAIAIFLGWLTAMESENAAAALIAKDRMLDSVLVTVLLFFVLLMILMGRRWTRYDFGIAFGFAIYAAGFLIASTTWVRVRSKPTIVDQLPVISYDISSLVWLYCFWSKEKPQVNFPASEGQELVQQARTWEKVLKDWLRPKKKLF